jgi:putative YhdH/YhfP family quinone oxidoreductase
VGSIAIDMLSRLGYSVTALTGKDGEADYLKQLGAKDVMSRKSLDLAKIKPLDRATWAGAVDNLGGEVLAWMASTMMVGGTIAAVGLAASMSLNTTVAPFILRGVSLLGIDSGTTPMPLRQEVWRRLAGDLRPPHLKDMTRTIAFDELPRAFDGFIKGAARGRVVVDMAA